MLRIFVGLVLLGQLYLLPVSAANNSHKWLPVLVYDLLDNTPTVPVKPANTRESWDNYSLAIVLNESASLTLQWQSQENIHHYNIDYQVAGGAWLSIVSANNNLVLPPELVGEIEFRVSGCSSETECSSYSNELNTVLVDTASNPALPSVITLPRYIKYGEPFAIEWSEVSNASAYQLQRQDKNLSDNFTTIFTGIPDKNNGNFEVRSMALAEGDYCYRLSSQLENVFSTYSQPVCTHVGERELDIPNAFAAEEIEAGRYQVSWQAVPHAVSYKLEREALVLTSVSQSTVSSVSGKATLSKSQNSLTVYQSNNQGVSTSPTIAEIANADYQVQSNTTNNMQVSTQPLEWQTLTSDNENSKEQVHTINTFDRDGLQKYRVSACNVKGDCGPSIALNYNVAAADVYDGIPEQVSSTLQSGSTVNLSWNKVTGADFYVVEMRREGSSFVRSFPDITDTNMSYSFAHPGDYVFSVYACINTGFCGGYSPVETLEYHVAGTPNDTPNLFYVPTNTPAGTKVEMTWQAPLTAGVVEYEIQGELKNTIAKQAFIADSKGYFKFERDALAPGRQYCYKVRAIFANDSKGDFSDTLCTVVGEFAFSAPTNLRVEQVDSQNYKVSWDAVSGASHYLLEPQISVSEWQAVQYSTATERMVKFNPFYKNIYQQLGHIAYRVSACNNKEYCGNYSRVYYSTLSNGAFSATTPDTDKVPACLVVPEHVNQGESIKVSWCKPEATGVESYELVGELKGRIASGETDEFSLSLQALVTVTRPVLPEGREYCYKVRANYSNGEFGDYTATQCVIVDNISFPASEKMTAQQSVSEFYSYNIGWLPVSGAHHYQLEKVSFTGLLQPEAQWSAVACNVQAININQAEYVGCAITLSEADRIGGVGRIGLRVTACNKYNVCGNFERHYFDLYLANDALVYQDTYGNLFVYLAASDEYLALSESDGTWTAVSATPNFTLPLSTQYTIEVGEFGGNALVDFKIIDSSTETEIIFSQTDTGYEHDTSTTQRTIIFIHTDLLGSPVAETNANGVVL